GAVHDLHVWTISSGQVALSAHLELDEMKSWPAILEAAKMKMRERFGIAHVTLQPEIALKQPYEPKVRIIPARKDSGLRTQD
ncbi:MAG: hypothetical protein ACREV9_16230, partial [Burkholderiales bacterium]